MEHVTLDAADGSVFEETLPEELPACEFLDMYGVSPGTLRALSHCELPRLADVSLQSWHTRHTSVAGLDFSWLYQCCWSLQSVKIHVPNADIAADVEQELDERLAWIQVTWEGMLDAEAHEA